jgi:hypothetical protein
MISRSYYVATTLGYKDSVADEGTCMLLGRPWRGGVGRRVAWHGTDRVWTCLTSGSHGDRSMRRAAGNRSSTTHGKRRPGAAVRSTTSRIDTSPPAYGGWVRCDRLAIVVKQQLAL